MSTREETASNNWQPCSRTPALLNILIKGESMSQTIHMPSSSTDYIKMLDEDFLQECTTY